MRDPELEAIANQAAAELEQAWYSWRLARNLPTNPRPTVTSYVGYTLEIPWGEPRVIFGLPVADAQQLTALLRER